MLCGCDATKKHPGMGGKGLLAMAKAKPGNCSQCGILRARIHSDHIIPKWRLAKDDPLRYDPSNRQLLCANCHEDKTIEDLKDYSHTPETRAKISASQKRNPEFLRKASQNIKRFNASRVGSKWPEETLKRMSEAAKKRWSGTPKEQRQAHMREVQKMGVAAREANLPSEVREAKRLLREYEGKQGTTNG